MLADCSGKDLQLTARGQPSSMALWGKSNWEKKMNDHLMENKRDHCLTAKCKSGWRRSNVQCECRRVSFGAWCHKYAQTDVPLRWKSLKSNLIELCHCLYTLYWKQRKLAEFIFLPINVNFFKLQLHMPHFLPILNTVILWTKC